MNMVNSNLINKVSGYIVYFLEFDKKYHSEIYFTAKEYLTNTKKEEQDQNLRIKYQKILMEAKRRATELVSGMTINEISDILKKEENLKMILQDIDSYLKERSK